MNLSSCCDKGNTLEAVVVIEILHLFLIVLPSNEGFMKMVNLLI